MASSWADIHGEASTRTAQLTKVSVGPDTKFWWVKQSVNFDPVYGGGTLWAPLKDRRGQQVDHWRTLDRVLPGDLVIHYARPEVRAISRVATRPQPAYPPRGYDDVAANTKGTLVLTEPLLDTRVPRDEALAILEQDKCPVTGGRTLRNDYDLGPGSYSSAVDGSTRRRADRPRLSWTPWPRNFDISLLLSISEFHRSFASRVPGAAEEPAVAPFAFPHRVFLAFRADHWGDIVACRGSDLDDTISDQLEEER